MTHLLPYTTHTLFEAASCRASVPREETMTKGTLQIMR